MPRPGVGCTPRFTACAAVRCPNLCPGTYLVRASSLALAFSSAPGRFAAFGPSLTAPREMVCASQAATAHGACRAASGPGADSASRTGRLLPGWPVPLPQLARLGPRRDMLAAGWGSRFLLGAPVKHLAAGAEVRSFQAPPGTLAFAALPLAAPCPAQKLGCPREVALHRFPHFARKAPQQRNGVGD